MACRLIAPPAGRAGRTLRPAAAPRRPDPTAPGCGLMGDWTGEPGHRLRLEPGQRGPAGTGQHRLLRGAGRRTALYRPAVLLQRQFHCLCVNEHDILALADSVL